MFFLFAMLEQHCKKRRDIVQFIDETDFSFFPKCAFMVSITMGSGLAAWLMLADETSLIDVLKPYAIDGNFIRQGILIFCLFFYILRLGATVFIFLKRKMTWGEMLLVSALMSFALFSFGRVGGSSHRAIAGIDYTYLFLYLLGSWINTWSEFTRYRWKKIDTNKGQLYTQGLFRYAMHINYFGDVLLFAGLALLTRQMSMLFIPLAMALNFIIVIIPRLDDYLLKKYGDAFADYAQKTRKLIPGIY